MSKSILEKLDAIEKLVKEIRKEIFLNGDFVTNSAPIYDEILAHKITLYFNNEETLEYNLDDMEIIELQEIAEELEIDLPKEARKEDIIAAILELHKQHTFRE